MGPRHAFTVAIAALALAGCQHPTTPPPTTTPPTTTAAPAQPGPTDLTGAPVRADTAPTSACTVRHTNGNDLPDPVCTPGATNPVVTQATITQTICVKGWTDTVRPSTSVTGPLKKRIAAAYGMPAVGELDHLIPLELGGATVDPANLWVEPGSIPNPKDTVESRLKAAVCAGRISLADAQHRIATDWPTATDGPL